MSAWRDDRNRKSRARLDRALPAIFPKPVLQHALARPLIPPTPRRAMEGYWRAHPLRADRLARALAALSGHPAGWSWTLDPSAASEGRKPTFKPTFRTPPAPFREPGRAAGPGTCCVCGQPVYRFGWHRDLWNDGRPNRRATWHSACVVAWQLWCAPADQVQALKRQQNRRCRESGKRLLRGAEVDHRVPLFRVWREHRDMPWPELLAFWGGPNLQVINKAAHLTKCAAEAASRARPPQGLATHSQP